MTREVVVEGLFKVLDNGKGPYSGKPWPLPNGDEPGEWMEVSPPLEMCRKGLHLTDWRGVWKKWIKAGATIYVAEADGERIGDTDDNDRKIAVQRARLVREVRAEEMPQWWRDAQEFIASIPKTPWFQPQGEPDPAWRVFSTWAAARAAARPAAGDAAWAASWAAARAAARAAAGDAAWAAARAAARAAAGDAGLIARCIVVADVMEPQHLAHARARWDVWQRGYGLYGDVDGVLYVYRSL